MSKYNVYIEDVSVEALFNKLGGINGVKRFLQDKTKVVEAEEIVKKLLEPIGTVTILATKKKFVAKKKFIIDTSDKAKIKISYLGDNFKKWFLDKAEEPIKETKLRYDRLTECSVDEPIITELGGEEKAETTLTEVFSLMEKQPNGKDGDLLNNGYANIFYVRDADGVLRAVNVNWNDGGWNVNANTVENPNRWNVGNVVFSRNYCFSSVLLAGVFCFQSLFPSTKLSAYFFKF